MAPSVPPPGRGSPVRPKRAFTFLVNPASGGGSAPEAIVPVARLLRADGARVDVAYSPGPLAARALVIEAVDRGDVVVAVGGDGTLASLAGEVSLRGGTLGLLPAGRGNDFARALGLPADAEGRARVLLSARPRQVDLIAWTSPDADGPARRVAGSVYAGVDARAAAMVDAARLVPRAMQYPLAAVRALASYRPARYRVAVDGRVHEVDAATVVVANSGWYGHGMHVAPDAEPADGLLDVVVVAAASKRALIRALPTIYDGSHVHRPEVTVVRGKRIELSARPGRGPGVPVGGDGEPLGTLPRPGAEPAVAEVLPGALTVLG